MVLTGDIRHLAILGLKPETLRTLLKGSYLGYAEAEFAAWLTNREYLGRRFWLGVNL